MKKNLVLVSLDCARADVVYGSKFPATSRLMREGTSFMNAISSAPLTPISHATVLTGLQPKNHGIRHLFKEKLRKGVVTIQQLLRRQGYATGAVVSCPGMNRWYGFGKGFDMYDDEIPRLPDGSDPLQTVDVKLRGMALKPANVVSERSIRWLEHNAHEPFCLFAHFFDAHWPYSAPRGFGGKNDYENSLAFADFHLGRILEKIDELGLRDDTAIICFSDHGEDLNGLYPNDKGGDARGHPEESGHGCLLYEQTQRVVLVIRDQIVQRNRQVDAQVRLVDVFPTILELLDVGYPGRLDGESLLAPPGNKPRIAYSETLYAEELDRAKKRFRNAKTKVSLRVDNKFKMIVSPESGETEFYDLENDPNELKNLAL